MRSSPAVRRTIDALVLSGVLACIASVLPPRLWLAAVAATGGDTASHFPTAQMVAERLLPQGLLLGWMPDNYAGFPIFQPYFPAPFVLIAALAPALGIERSFNLVTVAGTFLLPLAAYVCFRLLRFRFPVPVLAAVSTLPLLLDESSSLWGGNLLSTLAGEFAYSLSLPLLLLFLGCAGRDLDSSGRARRAGVLLALLGLTHGYAFLFGSVVALALPWTQSDRWRSVWFLARLYAVAVGLLAFWLVPALLYADYGTPYRDLWPVSWRAAVPLSFWPWLLPALAFGLWRLISWWRAGRPAGALSPESILWLGIPAALLLYRLAAPLGVVDIRFLPFAQLTALLLSALPFGALASRLRAGALIPLAALLAAMLFLDPQAGAASRWAEWNYSGFEAKPGWPAFSRLQKRLAGSLDDPRVAWEHSSLHTAVGTVRAFESTPRFSGRATLEGVYNQSSASSPFIFFLQSEISSEQSCPFPDYHCSGLDPSAAVEHLELFNAPQVVVRSAQVAAAFARSPAYELELEEPPYRVYRLKESSSSYVVPLESRPLVVRSLATPASWRLATFRWFQKPGAGRVPLIRPASPTAPEFALEIDTLPDQVPNEPLPGASEVVAEARLLDQAIAIRTSKPGHPLLIKVSFHPRWRAIDGSPIYQASPNFLLVVPRGPSLELRFESPPLVRIGTLASALTFIAIVIAAVCGRFQRGRSWALRLSSRWPTVPDFRLPTRLLALMPLGALALLLFVRPTDARHEMRRAQEALATAGCGESRPRFERVVELSPASYPALMARLDLARCAAQESRWMEAVEGYRRFVADYPQHPERPGAALELGRALWAGGRPEAARQVWQELANDDPDTYAAQQAREELAKERG